MTLPQTLQSAEKGNNLSTFPSLFDTASWFLVPLSPRHAALELIIVSQLLQLTDKKDNFLIFIADTGIQTEREKAREKEREREREIYIYWQLSSYSVKQGDTLTRRVSWLPAAAARHGPTLASQAPASRPAFAPCPDNEYPEMTSSHAEYAATPAQPADNKPHRIVSY